MTSAHDSRWLGRFRAPVVIRSEAALHLYAAADADTGAPRLVLLAAPGSRPADAVASLDGIARGHGAIDHPHVPRLVERGRAGDIEFVALASAARADIATLQEALRQRGGVTLGFLEALGMHLMTLEVLAAAHATPDPADGLPLCLGRMSSANLLLAADGQPAVLGFGRPPGPGAAWIVPAVGEHVAPELAGGARPTVRGDLFAFARLFAASVSHVNLSAELAALLAERSSSPEVMAVSQELAELGNMFQPELRPASAAAVLALDWRRWGLLGIAPDIDGFRRFAAEQVRVHGEATARPGRDDATLPGTARPTRAAALPCILGRYQLERALGEGGMGSVFLAWDRQLQQHVTVKRLHQPDQADARERFLREVRVARQVQDPHLMRGFDLISDGGHAYAILEYIEGERLDAHLSQAGATRAAALLADVASALAALHAAGVVHRDVKPANILVHPQRGAVLVDLGLALEPDSDLTATGQRMGTPRYMSPEQTRGEPVGPEADVYSLARTAAAVLDPLPRALAAVLEPCLGVPGDRPTAAALARDLRALSAERC